MSVSVAGIRCNLSTRLAPASALGAVASTWCAVTQQIVSTEKFDDTKYSIATVGTVFASQAFEVRDDLLEAKATLGDLPKAVKKGDTVVVLEAMKMENNITAECDGKITGICVAAGDSVLEGTTLVTIG